MYNELILWNYQIYLDFKLYYSEYLKVEGFFFNNIKKKSVSTIIKE